MRSNVGIRIILAAITLLSPVLAVILYPQTISAATYIVTNTNNSGAGSLRQAITDANANPGNDNITFNIPPTDPNYYSPSSGIGWWRIVVTTALPTLTGAVTIDGNTQTINRGDTNPGQVGTGSTVGVDALLLPYYNKTEIELTTSTNNINGLTINADNITIKGFAIYGFKRNSANTSNAQVRITSGTNILIENFLIGTRADGSNPGFDTKTSGIYSASGAKGTIQNNYIGYNISGIYFAGCSNWIINGNEVFQNALLYPYDGINLTSSASNINVQGNLCRDNGGSGIDGYRSSGSLTIVNNTSRGNGLYGTDTSGIRLYGTTHNISKNICIENAGPGIIVPYRVSSTYQNYAQIISQNSCYDNGGLGIDVVRSGTETNQARKGDGVNINDGIYNTTYGNLGIDYPVLTTATLVGNTLHLEGYTGTSATGTTFANCTLEFFIAAPDPSGYGEGKTYLGSLTTGATNSFTGNLDVTGKGLLVTNQITGTARDANGNTSEFSYCFLLTVIDNPILTLEVTPPSYGFAGHDVNYEAMATNVSSSAAYNTVYIWQLPVGMTFVSANYPSTYDPATRTLTFNLGTMNPGASLSGVATVHLDAGLTEGTILTTTSTLTWKNILGVTADIVTHNSSIIVHTKPALSINWTTPPSANAGENILLEGLLRNVGTSTAYSGLLVMQLPVEMTFVSSSHSALWNSVNRTITWNLGNIASGIDMPGWVTVLIDSEAGNGVVLDMLSQLTWQDSGGNSYGPQEQLFSITVYNEPQLTITKEGPSEAQVGSNITYTGTLTNSGGSTAFNVVLVDYLPVGMTYVSSSHNAVYNPADGTITWSMGNLNSQAAITGWVSVYIDSGVANNTLMVNSFQVTWQDNLGTNFGPSSASRQVIAHTTPLLTITKEGPDQATIGQYITFTGTLTNIGGLAATNAILVDYLPAGMTFVSSSHNAVYNAASRTVTWALGTVNPGVAMPGWVTVHIDNSVPNGSQLVNMFQVTWQDAGGSSYGPISATKEVVAYTSPILAIHKTGPAFGHPGESLTFTISLSNSGGLSAQDVVLNDYLPTKYSYVSSTPAGSVSNGIVTWNLGTISAGGSASISMVVTVDNAITNETQLINNASVTWRDSLGGMHGPVTSSVTTTIIKVPFLVISKTGPSVSEPSDNCTYTITILNKGESSATSVVLNDMFPSKMSYISCTGGGTYTPTGVVTWNFANLPSEASQTVTVTLQVDPGITENLTLDNSAAVYWQDISATNYGPAGALASTNIHPHPTLSIAIAGPASAQQGSSIGYALTLANPSIFPAYNCLIQCMLPIGFSYSSSSPQGTYSNGMVTWNAGTLASGQHSNFVITTIASTVSPGSYVIVISASSWQYPVGTNYGPAFATTSTRVIEAPIPPPPPTPVSPSILPKDFESSSSAEQNQYTLPRIVITNLNVQPQQVYLNQPVTVFANIANRGDIANDYTVILKINGLVEETRTGKINGRVAIPLQFTINKDKPGIYNIDINGQQTNFTVIGSSNLTDTRRTIFIVGFFLLFIGLITILALLIRRRNSNSRGCL